MKQLDLSQDTLRQRRNLMSVSMLLILIAYADVTINEKVNFLGMSLSIGQPEILINFLIIAEAYFLWRFYQYFATDKAFYNLQSQYREIRDRAFSLAIVKAVCKKIKTGKLDGKYCYEDLVWQKPLYYSIRATFYYPDPKNPAVNAKDSTEFRLMALRIELVRIKILLGFLFRGRILTDYYIPYGLACWAGFLSLTRVFA